MRQEHGRACEKAGALDMRETCQHDSVSVSRHDGAHSRQVFTLPSNPERKRKQIGCYVVVACMMIPDLCKDFGVALPKSKCETSADVSTESVRTSASSHKIHASDGATIPPRPIGVTYH